MGPSWQIKQLIPRATVEKYNSVRPFFLGVTMVTNPLFEIEDNKQVELQKINPLLDPTREAAVELNTLAGRGVHFKKVSKKRRELRDARRAENAAATIEGFTKNVEIFGFTKGQFSLIDLADAVLDYTGPAEIFVSTWTAATADLDGVLDWIERGRVIDARWLVDLTFQRRAPELAHKIRQIFGPDSIRVAQTHAKFMLIENQDWSVVIRTSMNLNFNPRFEDFTIAHDPELADFLRGIMSEIWNKQAGGLALDDTKKIQRHFKLEL